MTFFVCGENVCLDVENAKKLGINIKNNETYILKLENLLKALADPM